MMPSLSLRLLVLTAPDRSSWALIGLERSFLCLQLFSSQELAANYHLFCACFGSFLLLRCFSCPLGLAASVSFASSSDTSLVRGFPVFLVRDAWSVLAPGQPSCCVCGLLACASGRLCFWLCRAGVCSVCSGLVCVSALVGALRPLPWWVSLCTALASSWAFLRGVTCRRVFDRRWFECLSAVRSGSGFVLCEVYLPLSAGGIAWRFERLLSPRSRLPAVPDVAVLR